MRHQYTCKSGRKEDPYLFIFSGSNILRKKQVESCHNKRVKRHTTDAAQHNGIHQSDSHASGIQNTSRHGRHIIPRYLSECIKGNKYCGNVDNSQIYFVGFLQRKSNYPQKRREIHKNITVENRDRIAISVQPAWLDSNRELKYPPPDSNFYKFLPVVTDERPDPPLHSGRCGTGAD